MSVFLNEHSFDITCISEHWCTVDTLKILKLCNYKLMSFYCRTEHIHGGVCIYARSNLLCKEVCIKKYTSEFNAEFCAMEIGNKTLIITVYRSGRGDDDMFLQLFDQLLNDIVDKYSRIFILGDFNIDFKGASSILSELASIMECYGLCAAIVDYTRVFNNSKSCIDNILTNICKDDFVSGVIEPGISDHYGQYINVNLDVESVVKRHKVRKITKLGLLKLKSDLENMNFNDIYEADSVEYMADSLLTRCMTSISQHIPLCTVGDNAAPVNWFNNCLKEKRKSLSTVKLISNNSSNVLYKDLYKLLLIDYKKSIVLAKRKAYDEYIENSHNRSKDVWKIIKYETNQLNPNTDSNNISADDYNNFFVHVASDVIKDLSIDADLQSTLLMNIPCVPHSFAFLPIIEDDIRDAIRHRKRSHSYDMYLMSSSLIEVMGPFLIKPLTHLFNKCINEGVFPNSLKKSRVVPIYKNGDNNNLGNYRPISIVPLFGKIFEIVIKNRLNQYFEKYDILHSSQFGFRNKHCTIQAVARIVEDIVTGLEKGEHIGLTLCDLSKAFDCVSHELLIRKLSKYGIRGPPLDLLQSYLNDRTQCVSVNGKMSDLCEVVSGVPQGSVLGPLLFIVYINDLFCYLFPERGICYADDTSLLSAANSLDDLTFGMSRIVNLAEIWFTHNSLRLNVDKTQRIIFTNKAGSVVGDCNENVKILGLTLDNNLNWKSHILILKTKLSSVFFIVRRIRDMVSDSTLLTIYYSMFQCHLRYGVHLWGNSSHSITLFRLQKKVVRAIARASHLEHCKPYFVKFQILTLPSLYILHQLLEIHKTKNAYSLSSSYHNYNTRGSDMIRPPRYRLDKSSKNSLNIGLYNLLHRSTKDLCFKQFKLNIKRFLLQNAFYSVGECMLALPCLVHSN